MLLEGSWRLCDDGELRPVIRAQVQRGDGSWAEAPLLVDTGADRTVLSLDVYRQLGLPADQQSEPLVGVGGAIPCCILQTSLRMTRENGSEVLFRGQFTAAMHAAALDMSVLGRDIMNWFTVIVDRPQERVCLLGQNHHYQILA